MKISGCMTVKNGCVTPGHKILMADLTWKLVEDLKQGDELLAFDEKPSNGCNGRQWRVSKVIHNIPVKKRVCRIELSSGEVLTATEDHPWLVKRNGYEWVQTKDLLDKRITSIPKFIPVWESLQDYGAGYLAGFYDGEGNLNQCAKKGRNDFHFQVVASQKNKDVIRETERHLRNHGFDFVTNPYDNTDRDLKAIRVNGGRPNKMRFLGSVRPTRLLKSFAPNKLGRMDAYEQVRIQGVVPLGVQTVMGLGTSTETYIVNGFGSHNTRYDYPFIEALQSIIGLVDEFVICEGYSEDSTMEKLQQFKNHVEGVHNIPVKIVHAHWEKKHYTDITNTTNVAIEHCTGDYYIMLQADEIIHENSIPAIRQAIESQQAVLIGQPVYHFWGSFNTVFKPGVFYDSIFRIARRDLFPNIRCIWDGMTLGTATGEGNGEGYVNDPKYSHGMVNEPILHYGYARKPLALIKKAENMFPWWGFAVDQRFYERREDGSFKAESMHPADHLMPAPVPTPAVLAEWAEQRREILEKGLVGGYELND